MDLVKSLLIIDLHSLAIELDLVSEDLGLKRVLILAPEVDILRPELLVVHRGIHVLIHLAIQNVAAKLDARAHP